MSGKISIFRGFMVRIQEIFRDLRYNTGQRHPYSPNASLTSWFGGVWRWDFSLFRNSKSCLKTPIIHQNHRRMLPNPPKIHSNRIFLQKNPFTPTPKHLYITFLGRKYSWFGEKNCSEKKFSFDLSIVIKKLLKKKNAVCQSSLKNHWKMNNK